MLLLHPFSFLGILLGLALGAPAQDDPKQPLQPLTLEQTGKPGSTVRFSGRAPSVRWAEDGKHLILPDKQDVWVHPLTGAEQKPEAAAEKPDLRPALEKGFRELPGFDEEAANRASRAFRSTASDDDRAQLIRFENDLYFHGGGETIRRLTADDALESDATLSPNGSFVAFTKRNDLYFIETATGREHRVTHDGSEDIYNGRLDWVYQEEIYGRGNYKAFWWSPDSSSIAFLRLDDRQVPRLTIVDQRSRHPRVEVANYPKSGDPNPEARLGVHRVRQRETRWMDLGTYGTEYLIVNVGWRPNSRDVIFQVQDRIQTWLDLLAGSPRTGEVRRLLRETSESWVNVLSPPRWLEDGSFLWESERTGYLHLYHYAADGELKRPMTQGAWSVTGIEVLDEKAGELVFSGTKDGEINRHVYRLGLDGKGLRRLTAGDGSHSIRFNGDRSLFLDSLSNVASAPSVRLCQSDGSVVRELGAAEIPALSKYHFSLPELHRIPTRDGFEMDATLIKPPDFDPNRSYPVWLMTYSGPAAPSVRNRWSGSAWSQFLAQQGILVFQVNNRSSSARGQLYSAACYLDLGRSELQDLEDAIAWLTRHPWADAERVGISGVSYGGFMTAYALTHSKAFRLGIAGAGVYDWLHYDTIYTERYMSTPSENPEGYRSSSCIEAAADLHGHLLLWHGEIDDNVYATNTSQFALALQQAGHHFEMMMYPGSRHGVGSSAQRWHLRQLEWRTIQAQLTPEAAIPARPTDATGGD